MSKYKVTVNDPALPDGHEVEVPGLGVFKNGSTRQIPEEDAEYFRDINSQVVDVETDDRPALTGAADRELRRGPTVLEAFRDHPTVKVESASEKPVEKSKAQSRTDDSDKKES